MTCQDTYNYVGFFFFLTRLNHVIDLLDVFQEMLEKKKFCLITTGERE